MYKHFNYVSVSDFETRIHCVCSLFHFLLPHVFLSIKLKISDAGSSDCFLYICCIFCVVVYFKFLLVGGYFSCWFFFFFFVICFCFCFCFYYYFCLIDCLLFACVCAFVRACILLIFCFTQPKLEFTTYHNRANHANYYTRIKMGWDIMFNDSQ